MWVRLPGLTPAVLCTQHTSDVMPNAAIWCIV